MGPLFVIDPCATLSLVATSLIEGARLGAVIALLAPLRSVLSRDSRASLRNFPRGRAF